MARREVLGVHLFQSEWASLSTFCIFLVLFFFFFFLFFFFFVVVDFVVVLLSLVLVHIVLLTLRKSPGPQRCWPRVRPGGRARWEGRAARRRRRCRFPCRRRKTSRWQKRRSSAARVFFWGFVLLERRRRHRNVSVLFLCLFLCFSQPRYASVCTIRTLSLDLSPRATRNVGLWISEARSTIGAIAAGAARRAERERMAAAPAAAAAERPLARNQTDIEAGDVSACGREREREREHASWRERARARERVKRVLELKTSS